MRVILMLTMMMMMMMMMMSVLVCDAGADQWSVSMSINTQLIGSMLITSNSHNTNTAQQHTTGQTDACK